MLIHSKKMGYVEENFFNSPVENRGIKIDKRLETEKNYV